MKQTALQIIFSTFFNLYLFKTMKSKLFISLAVAVVAIVAATIFAVNHFSPKSHLSVLTLANLEAQTDGEDNSNNRGVGKEKNTCSFSGKVDANGYVTFLGIRKFVGGTAGADYHVSYTDAQIDCLINGNYSSCSDVTCADFWGRMAN
jgi:hypothetical protein